MRKKILVVDDEAQLRLLSRKGLEAAGYDVVEAANGAECLIQIRERSPDLILLDLNMPNMGGIGALHAIKQHVATKGIPVIVVSGAATEQNVRLVNEFGGSDFITKPYSVSELVKRVQNQLIDLDYRHVRGILMAVERKDDSLSFLASVVGEVAWEVYPGKLEGLEVTALVACGLAPADASRLSEGEAATKVKIIASLGSRWKLLWPLEAVKRAVPLIENNKGNAWS